MARKQWIWIAALAATIGVGACREEGAAEKAGRKLDQAIDDLRHPNEGALEKAGRKLDEAVDDASDAVQDAVEDVRKDVAKQIEGD